MPTFDIDPGRKHFALHPWDDIDTWLVVGFAIASCTAVLVDHFFNLFSSNSFGAVPLTVKLIVAAVCSVVPALAAADLRYRVLCLNQFANYLATLSPVERAMLRQALARPSIRAAWEHPDFSFSWDSQDIAFAAAEFPGIRLRSYYMPGVMRALLRPSARGRLRYFDKVASLAEARSRA